MKTKNHFDILEKSHDKILKSAESLYDAATNLRYEGKVAFGRNVHAARKHIADIKNEFIAHQLLEEALFKFLEAHIPRLQTVIQFFRGEHRELKTRLEALSDLISKLSLEKKEMKRTQMAEKIKDNATYFIYLMRCHTQAEEESVHRSIVQDLKNEEKKAIHQKISVLLEDKNKGEGMEKISIQKTFKWQVAFLSLVFMIVGGPLVFADKLPREKAQLTYAPEVPPPITRKTPAIVEVSMISDRKLMEIKPGMKYEYWTFNDHVPGPFIRVREGDVIEVHHSTKDATGMPHNIDFHAVTGPGGGAPVTTAVKGEEKIAWFKMTHPGLFVYHCAAPPVMDHIANGMYGLILVEPKKGLSKVDKEFYVFQSEFYPKRTESMVVPEVDHSKTHGKEAEGKDDFWGDTATGDEKKEEVLTYSHQAGLDEHPLFVVFNGKFNSLVGEGALKAKTGDKVRIFFGNGGPNLISSFHVIGEIFDNVYREGDLISQPGHSIQTTLVPAGGSTVVEFELEVPGNYTLVDHAIFRVEKGAVGFLSVEGKPRYDIYKSQDDPVLCKGCLVHP